MSDLISRQAALDVTTETVFVEYEDGDPRKEESIILQTKAAIRERIKDLPSVQPNHNAEVSKMEIIHCENCEHWDTSWETVYGLHYCPMIDMATKKNFFCKYGTERKGEAE